MNQKTLRFALAAAVSAAVSLPLIAQTQGTKPAPAAPAPTSPTAAPVPSPLPPPATQPAVDPNKVVITIGDTKITAGEFNTFFSDLDPSVQAQVLSRPDGRRKLADEMINLKLLSSEARKRKLDETLRTKIVYDQLLANALMTDLAEQKGADEKFFADNKDYFDEVKARHILIATEGSGVPGAKLTDAQAKAKADDLIKRLAKGEDFATIAKTESDDKGSAALGGNLGTVSRGMMVPQFETVAYALHKNDISQPVKTQFGYHIIQVLDRSSPTFDQAKARVPRRRLEMLLEQLKQSEKPEVDDAYFGAAAAAAPAPAQPQTASVPSSTPVK